jgi:hypothetical protein
MGGSVSSRGSSSTADAAATVQRGAATRSIARETPGTSFSAVNIVRSPE